jgi:uncharacterized protein (DUF1800 family)
MHRAALVLSLVAACSHGVRKDVTPPLAAQAPEAAAREAAMQDGVAQLTPAEMVEHVLSRATFGARPRDRALAQSEGIAQFLEGQLHPERIDDSALEKRLEIYDVLQRDSSSLVRELKEMREKRKQDGPQPGMKKPGFDFVAQLAQVKLLRAVASERQLEEVMADFWFNHFNVFAGKEMEAALLPEYEARVLRPNSLGNFGELLEATAHSPAMLVYLDNWRSTAPRRGGKGLNENYARELLELHTLGVDGGYTQTDIIEVARCFTGWTVEEPQKNPRFIFRPRQHDYGQKRVLGHVLPPGRGEEDGEEVLRILAAHPSTAHFIAKKLARRFVSDDPPEALVARVAATCSRTQGDIRSMLRTIFEAPELWSRRALRAKVRSPLELVAASVRALDAQVDDPLALSRSVARIGEPLYAAQPPTGYGDTAQAWLSSGALLARIDFGLQLANGQLAGVKVDLTPLAAREPNQLLENAAARLGAGDLSGKTREYILEQLRDAPPKPELQAARAVGLLLGAPELQRR